MANELSEDELLGAYVADAPFAQSFPMTSFTHDNGLNDQLIQYYADAINAVLVELNQTRLCRKLVQEFLK
jgi:hypothetical protein